MNPYNDLTQEQQENWGQWMSSAYAAKKSGPDGRAAFPDFETFIAIDNNLKIRAEQQEAINELVAVIRKAKSSEKQSLVECIELADSTLDKINAYRSVEGMK